jgi:hypothetical protein
MPLTRPSHLSPHTFDELKVILKDYFVSRDKAPSQAELAIQAHLNKLIQKEREKDSSCNDQQVDISKTRSFSKENDWRIRKGNPIVY